MPLIVLRTISGKSMVAVVVISPATIAKPVFTRVSRATRALVSLARMASRTASEIWSAILSGWPSVTDSEENKYLELFMNSPRLGVAGGAPEGRENHRFRIGRMLAKSRGEPSQILRFVKAFAGYIP